MFALVWFTRTRTTLIIDTAQISDPNGRQKGAVTEIFLEGRKKKAKVIEVSGILIVQLFFLHLSL